MFDAIEWLIRAPFICCGWLIIGAIAGALARRLTGSQDKPLINDMILGLAGAVVGGILAGMLSIDTDRAGLTQVLVTLVVATAGASVLIIIGRALGGGGRRRRRR